MREREKETETRKGNVSTTGERNVKERKAGDKKERCKRRQNGKIKCGILLLLICINHQLALELDLNGAYPSFLNQST